MGHPVPKELTDTTRGSQVMRTAPAIPASTTPRALATARGRLVKASPERGRYILRSPTAPSINSSESVKRIFILPQLHSKLYSNSALTIR